MPLIDRLRLAFTSGVTLGDLAARYADIHGDRVLVRTDGSAAATATHESPTTWTAGGIRDQVDEWAGHIAAAIDPGDRVVVHLSNGFAFFMTCLAVSRAGGVVVPVNDKMRPAEVDHVIADSGARLVIDDVDRLTKRQSICVPTNVAGPTDVAAIFYTSGTTGLPKGALLTHAGLLSGTRAAALIPTQLRHDEAVFALPVAHIMGFVGLLGFLAAGIPTFVLDKFRPTDVLDAIEDRRASLFLGVPTMYRMLLEAGAADRDLKSVRMWLCGADAMPPELIRTFQRFGASATIPGTGRPVGQATFVEGYGMVELSGSAAFKITPPYAGRLFSKPVGMRLPTHRLRVVNDLGEPVRVGAVGELEVSGPGMLTGYHDNAAATAATITEDGWLRTGDLVRRGLLGTVEFVGREKDVVKVGGYSVFAAEVQAVLEACPGVAEAVVVGIDDARLGQVPAAALRRKPGGKVNVKSVERVARAKLADYKVPVRWLVVDELPRTGTEKVQRAAVRSLFD